MEVPGVETVGPAGQHACPLRSATAACRHGRRTELRELAGDPDWVRLQIQTALVEVQEEVELVDGVELPRCLDVGAAAQVEDEFGGAGEEFTDGAQVVLGHGPGQVRGGQQTGPDQVCGRGGDSRQVFEADGDGVHLANVRKV